MPRKCVTCKKTYAHFNVPGESKGLYCKKCSQPGMLNVTSAKCITCKKTQATFNVPGESKGLYCKGCSLPGMVDVTSAKCITCKETQATFNVPGESKRLYCKKCSFPGMVDVINAKCGKCEKHAAYGHPCNPRTTCRIHKEAGMIYRPRARCCFENCNNVATHGTREPLHCEEHRTEGDVNLVERTCPKCGTIDVIIEGLCVNFCGLSEQHVRLRKYQKVKEVRVLALLKTDFKEPSEYNVRVSRECGGVNAEEKEIGYDFGTHVVYVEVDENRHRSYCELGEVNRMKNIYMDGGGVPVVFIRYNPDNFRSVHGKRQKVSQADREAILLKWLKKYENSIPKSPLIVNYLFYDDWEAGKTFEYAIDPYNSFEEECRTCGGVFYIKSQYDHHQCYNLQ